MRRYLIAIIIVLVAAASLSAGKIAPSLRDAEGAVRVWVFFEEKPEKSADIARESLSERALARRASAGIELDVHDIPVNHSWVRQIVALGAELRRESRWLNAASFEMRPEILEAVAEFDFVREIRPMRSYRRPIEPVAHRRPSDSAPPDDFYGPTRAQLEMLGATELHDRGFNGQGVLVGMLDSGFRLTHRAFDSLDVVAKYDFMHNDTTVDWDTLAGDTDFYGFRHGTYCLGAVAGYSPGEVIGVAYRASVALAKTEDVQAEYVGEEDNWVAGIEWLDSLGADIVSSSLGYSYFDSLTPYTMDDLDGNTILVTVAADIAASRGICVVNSAGNERANPDWPTIIGPADGDSVLAVAAVGNDRVIAPFSSPGPSADGRIKPDISAVGYGTILVDAYADEGYSAGSGTSFSCPLIAGLCAAVKSARPELSGYNLAMAVRASGDRVRAYDPSFPADSADSDYGWGIPKGLVAAGLTRGLYGRAVDALSGQIIANKEIHFIYSGETRISSTDTFGIFIDDLAVDGQSVTLFIPGYTFSASYPIDGVGRAIRFNRLGGGAQLQVFPNPASSELKAVAYEGENALFTVYNAAGELVFEHSWPPAEQLQFIWPLTNSKGKPVANGIYVVRLATESETISEKIAVLR